MNTEEKYIRGLVNRVLEESIQEKAESIVKQLKTEIKQDEDSEEDEKETFKPMRKGHKVKKMKKDKDIKENSVTMTEDEMITFIENIVTEQKALAGMAMYKKSHKESGKENEDYIKSVTKKLKDYLKDGSKGKYETEPKVFPKNNGQLAKMDKKAYIPSKAVEEYIENFAYSPGMENLSYDEIKPNEEWMEMNIEGSAKTGNSPEYANAEDTGLGKKVNEKRKKNYYDKLKKQSYNKSPQPVTDIAGETTSNDSMKVDKIFKTLESKEETKKNRVNEELNKMNKLMDYNKNTQ